MQRSRGRSLSPDRGACCLLCLRIASSSFYSALACFAVKVPAEIELWVEIHMKLLVIALLGRERVSLVLPWC